MSHFGLSPRSIPAPRCEAQTKILDGPDKGQLGDRCKLNALPGTRFCRRHQQPETD